MAQIPDSSVPTPGAVVAPGALARIEEVRRHPGRHVPRLVLSAHVREQGILSDIAMLVNAFIGSMWTFVIVTTGIVVWLFAGNIVGFDKTPWPLLLTLLNLPQLSIMISLQVSANLAQKTSDARALADHETLLALHELSRREILILEGQNEILDLLKNRAEAA
jgi:hypothetical protein